MWKQLILVLLCLMICAPAVGQELQWKYEERCAPQVLADAWEYDGTILMTGYAGLHGVNAAWETPRVVVPIGRHPTGRLSPDGNWFASLQGHVIYSQSYNHEHVIEAIQVFSTAEDTLVYTIPWQNSWLQMWGYREFFWFDNEHILYEYSENISHELDEFVTIDPISGTSTPFEAQVDILDGGSGFQREYVQFPSPDFTRTVFKTYVPDETYRQWALYDIQSGETIAPIQTQDDASFAWQPDSAAFVGHITTEDGRSSLLLFDRDGNITDTILEFDSDYVGVPQNMRWSPDGRYLGFARSTLLVIDTQRNLVLDTCFATARGIVWSQDGDQIAFLEPGDGLQDVYVLDLDTWSFRIVARHIIETSYWHMILGWRSD